MPNTDEHVGVMISDIASGVRVGDVEYPGFPAAGAGVEGADPAIKVAVFSLLYIFSVFTTV